jgi:hypothetical protein
MSMACRAGSASTSRTELLTSELSSSLALD